METVEENIDYKMIGQRIKKGRKKAKMSKEKLAKKINVTPAYISKIEKDSAQITLKMLSQISMALNIKIEHLISVPTKETNSCLTQDFQELLSKCSLEKQKLIYNISKIVLDIKFV